MNATPQMYAPDYLRVQGLKLKDENLVNIATMIEEQVKKLKAYQTVAFEAQEMAKESALNAEKYKGVIEWAVWSWRKGPTMEEVHKRLSEALGVTP